MSTPPELRPAPIGAAPADRVLPLKAALPRTSGEPGEASLRLGAAGVWLQVGEEGDGGDVEVRELSGGAFRWEGGARRDSLVVGDLTLPLPMGAGARAREMLALGRIRARGAPHIPPLEPSRYVAPAPPLADAWLTRWMDADEILLAWLPTATDQPVPSAVGLEARGALRFLLTDRRAAAVALGPLGDVWLCPLPPRALTVERRLGRDRVQAGGIEWYPELMGEALFQELAPLPALSADDRVMEAARLSWLKRSGGDGEAARRLLDRLAARSDDPLAPLALAVVTWRGAAARPLEDALAAPQPREALSRLAADPASGEPLAAWAEGWALSGEERAALARGLMEVEAEGGRAPAASLPLHEAAHALATAAEKDPVNLAALDIALAEHRILAGAHEAARSLMEARLAALPDETLADLLPPEEADLTTGAGGQALRIRILELLVVARGDPIVPDLRATAELARLQPLVARRLEDLTAVASGSLAERASRVAALLAGEGLASAASTPPDPPRLSPLPAAALDELVQHPAARSGGALASLQGWMGKARTPDQGALRRWSEHLSATAWPQAAAAIADATLLLGLPADLDAYISRGEARVGIRAYSGDPPFLLIGHAHLEQGGDFSMSDAELRFALGAELAHLRFGHTRLTTSELWDGVLDRGSAVVDATMALLGPLGLIGGALTGLTTAGRIHEAGQAFRRHLATVQRGADGAASVMGVSARLKRWAAPARAEATAEVEAREELLAFCRSLQLTADRAGLILSGDVGAAARAILLSTRRHRPVLEIAARHGLDQAVARRDAGGHLLEQDLAIRLAALFAFYLSEDWVRAREAALGRGP